MYFLYIILSIKDSVQQQIHFNGNVFGKKYCRSNVGSLYVNIPIEVNPFFKTQLYKIHLTVMWHNKKQNA